MIELILTCVFISAAICGLWLCFEPNMVFAPIADAYRKWEEGLVCPGCRGYSYKRFWTWLRKPLFDCVTCMASIWGTIGWFAVRSLDGLQMTDVILWPMAILAIAFFNTIFMSRL